MSAARRAGAALLLLPLGACQYQRYQSVFGEAAVDDRQFLSLFANLVQAP